MLSTLMELKGRHAPEAAETTLEEVQSWFEGIGQSLPRKEVLALLKHQAPGSGLGRYISGRHGHPCRIRWEGGLGPGTAVPAAPASSAPAISGPAPEQAVPANLLDIPTSEGRVLLVVQGQLRPEDVQVVHEALQKIASAHEGDPETGQDLPGIEIASDLDLPDVKTVYQPVDAASRDGVDLHELDLRPDTRARRNEALEALAQQCLTLISERKPKFARVMIARYGLDGTGYKTLEETGALFDVTRERIRQIQATSVDVARNRLVTQAREVAGQWLLEVLDERYPRGGFVTTAELAEIRLSAQTCDGWAQLALDVGFGASGRGGEEPVMTALADHCLRPFSAFGNVGWLTSEDWSDQDLRDVVAWLGDFANSDIRLPLALAPFAEQLGKPLALLEAVLAAHPALAPYAGYVLRGRGSTGHKRAVRAHVLAAKMMRDEPLLAFHDLWVRYRQCFEEIDPCSTHDLRMALSTEIGAPHLFIIDTHRSVFPLGDVAFDGGLDLSARFSPPTPETLQGDTGLVHQWLGTHGPSTRQELEHALGIPETSLNALLAQRSSAINVTPRHYWDVSRLPELEHWPWQSEDLVEEDAKDLITARQCGESPTSLYAGWTPRFELALCEQAERQGWSCHRALLWACNPEGWQVEPELRNRWLAKKEELAQRPEEIVSLPAINRLPDAERLLRFMLLAVRQGSISPVSANRVTRPRGPREMVNCALIAMLVRAGALSNEAERVMARHALGSEAQRWLSLLASEHVATGNLVWTRGIPRRLLEEALSSRTGGWAGEPEWTRLLSDLAGDLGVSATAPELDLVDEVVEPELGPEDLSEDISADSAQAIAHDVTAIRASPAAPSGDQLQPVELLVHRAQEGDSEAQYQLSRQLELGEGVPVNSQASLHWLRKAAASNHVKACVRLGSKLWLGELDPKDLQARSQGLAYLNVGTAKGHAQACYLVGLAYLRGDMVNRNHRAAINLLKRAARAGHPAAAFELAKLLRSKMESWVPDTVEMLSFAAKRNVQGARELLLQAEDEMGR